MKFTLPIIYLLLLNLLSIDLIAQKVNYDSLILKKVHFRSIGPFRGGRSAAVCGAFKNKQTFYFGGTGGGVFKTSDAGNNWKKHI